MRTNEILSQLSLDDLAQRYANCIVRYRDAFGRVRGWDRNVAGRAVFNFEGKWIPFDWKLLDTERLPARWYTNGKFAFYFCYKPRRQFCRGYSANTFQAYYVENNGDLEAGTLNTPNEFESMYAQATANKSLRNVTTEIFKTITDKTNNIILSPQLALVDNWLFYRTTLVGKYEDGVFELQSDCLVQELRESIRNVNWTLVKPKNREDRIVLKKKPRNLDIAFEEFANLMEAPLEPPRRTAMEFRVNQVHPRPRAAALAERNPANEIRLDDFGMPIRPEDEEEQN